MKQLKYSPNSDKIWHVFIAFGGRYDNNMYVIANSKKEAIKVAYKYVEIDGGEKLSHTSAERIYKDLNWLDDFKKNIEEGDPETMKLLAGEIDGFCYSAGT